MKFGIEKLESLCCAVVKTA